MHRTHANAPERLGVPPTAPADAVETIGRPWFVTRESARSEQKIIAHTGFLIFARTVDSTSRSVVFDSPRGLGAISQP